MVKKGNLKKGIMYECVKRKIPFVLAGSIRASGNTASVGIGGKTVSINEARNTPTYNVSSFTSPVTHWIISSI